MKKFCLLAGLLFTIVLFVQCASPKEKEEGMDLYLLIGQSNMAGRGVLDSAMLDLSNIYVINKENQWVDAKEPIHYDKSVAGTSLAASFAIIVRDNSGKKIGLIPCAIGGTSIDVWMPDVVDPVTKIMPYNTTIARTKEALKSGQLKGILWHQGESDSKDERYLNYSAKFDSLFNNLSKDLAINIDTIPVIVGEIGTFFSSQPQNKEALCIDSILHEKAKRKNIYCVSSEELTDKGDSTHFDTESYRELGVRYAKAYEIVKQRLAK